MPSPEPRTMPSPEAPAAAPSPDVTIEGPPSPAPSPADPSSVPPTPSATPDPSATPAPPPVEVISGPAVAPTPAPPGFSAVRDVSLASGVPDLVKGRRPVVPPVARMAGAGGEVQVSFAVDAAGISSVQKVDGPELLKEAARQAVSSWAFRRTTAERVFLSAVFNFQGDQARAEVRRAE
jgi:outer membrane biosynthesis protein TonB